MTFSNFVGIDLGTTYSSVGIIKNKDVVVLPNEKNKYITSSCVYFSRKSNDTIVGNSAKDQQVFYPENTIDNIKRFIGKNFGEKSTQENIRHVGYKVVEKSGCPLVAVPKSDQTIRYFTPEEISSMILKKMKSIVKQNTKKDINRAVITVPNYFKQSEINATINAANLAKIEVMKIMKETDAVALAFTKTILYKKLKRSPKEDINIIVYDLGGGTFDVSLVNIKGNIIEILSPTGDTNLGGENFNQIMVDWMIKDIYNKSQKQIRPKTEEFRRLHNSFERIKIQLSESNQAKIDVHNLLENYTYERTITRQEFEFACKYLFEGTLSEIDKVLNEANYTKEKIDYVVLVGGSTKIPYIQNMLEQYFKSKEKIIKYLDPETTVSYGATLQASMLDRSRNREGNDHIFSEDNEDLVLIDVVPISIGLESVGGKMNKLIYRNMPIPVECPVILTTYNDYQTDIRLGIYEGERLEARYNHYLGELVIPKISSRLRGEIDVICSMKMDENGMLSIHTMDSESKQTTETLISYNDIRISESDLKEMIKDAELHKIDDWNTVKRIDEMLELEDYIYKITRALKETQLEESKTSELKRFVEDTKNWLSRNRDQDADQHIQKRLKLRDFAKSIGLTISPKM